jgi:hypothetical protein
MGLAQSVVSQYVASVTADIAHQARRTWGNAAMRAGGGAMMHGGYTFADVLRGGGAVESERRKPLAPGAGR